MLIRICFLTFMVFVMIGHSRSDEPKRTDVKITSKVYANLFVRRREEQMLLLRQLQSENYEKRYRLLDMALQKILEGLQEHRATLLAADFSPDFTDFPQNVQIADALAFVLENTCLVGDLILHFPDMCYRILRGNKTWRALVNWNLNFTRNAVVIVDDLSQKMLDLLNQELNEDQRSPDYLNPYLEENNQKKSDGTKTKEQKKSKKKLKRGPALGGVKQEL